MIFIDFGAFNRAGKTVSKIGIYALPPLKSQFYRDFYKFTTHFRLSTVFFLKNIFYAMGF
jgi:hypothetical protein